MGRTRLAALVVGAVVASCSLWLAPTARGLVLPPPAAATRPVMAVGNGWQGSVDLIDARSHRWLRRVNVVPDLSERMLEILASPDRLAFYLLIQQAIGEGHDQLTDDMFLSADGRRLFVSRPSLADVVSIDIATGMIRWRFPMEGYRADHMAITADGSRLLVSDSTANVVHELDTATGAETGRFPSGDSPHESSYFDGDRLILHASIGRVYLPTDDPLLGEVRELSKGAQVLELVDADSLEVLRQWNARELLAAAGHPDMSAAVRPMAIAPDGRSVYFQVSFHHGFVEMDLDRDHGFAGAHVTRVAHLPISDEAAQLRPEQYPLDSAHHGLAINDAGTKLCVAGSVSNYAAIVDRSDFSTEIVSRGTRPYWATNGLDDTCWMSYANDNQIVVLDYATEREVARLDVGDHPQRLRLGVLAVDLIPLGR